MRSNIWAPLLEPPSLVPDFVRQYQLIGHTFKIHFFVLFHLSGQWCWVFTFAKGWMISILSTSLYKLMESALSLEITWTFSFNSFTRFYFKTCQIDEYLFYISYVLVWCTVINFQRRMFMMFLTFLIAFIM